jgi:hypothetical protein
MEVGVTISAIHMLSIQDAIEILAQVFTKAFPSVADFIESPL